MGAGGNYSWWLKTLGRQLLLLQSVMCVFLKNLNNPDSRNNGGVCECFGGRGMCMYVSRGKGMCMTVSVFWVVCGGVYVWYVCVVGVYGGVVYVGICGVCECECICVCMWYLSVSVYGCVWRCMYV